MNKKILFITMGIVVVIGGVAGTLLFQRLNNVPYELATVKRGDIIQEVSASGKVESPTKIDLHFKNSGKLIAMNAKVGEKITVGRLLAKQDTVQLDAQVSEMQAGIDIQKAKLDQLLSGTSPEDIAVAETAVINAETSAINANQTLEDVKKDLENVKNKTGVDLDNLYDDIRGILNDAYTKADDAVNRQTDDMFDNDLSSNPQLNFFSTDSQAETDSEWERIIIGSELKKWKTELDNLSPDYFDLDETLIKAKNHLVIIEDFLIRLNDAVQGAIGISQITINTYKTNINTGRTNINTIVSNINNQQQLIAAQKITNQKNIDSAQKDVNTAENNLKTAEGSLKTAQNQLALKKAPVRSSDVAVYRAQINQAEASLQKIQAQRDDLMLFAPYSGVVTSVNGEVGEIVGQDKIIVSFATGGALQIKLNVVEDAIVDVRLGQEARITFDAMGDQEFYGKVVAIDPAETVVGGAVYYQTTILFNKNDERVRSGMTANVWIKTAVSEDTLFIPESALQYKDGVKIVQVLTSDNVLDREIVAGIKNDIGMVEIISGLSEGEQVLLGDKKIKK